MNNIIVVFVTTKDKQQAVHIAEGLLNNKLIACANIINGVDSMFWWQGKIDKSKEVMLVLKTKQGLFKKLEAKVKAMHSYETPEIIALPIVAGSGAYLKWIEDICSGQR